MSASISAGESGRSGYDTDTQIQSGSGGGKYAYYPQSVSSFGWVTHEAVPNLNLMLGVHKCVRNPEERCFHSDSSFDFLLLTFMPNSWQQSAVSDARCQGSSYKRGKICTLEITLCVSVVHFCCLRGASILSLFVLWGANNQRVSIVVGKASDICLTHHLTWIRAVLDSWEGHRFVYSNWQRF